MYETFFAFSERPFSIAPDPRYLFLSERHREALAHLVYGLNDAGGFVLLTGEVGTGKTTLCRSLLTQVPANVDIAIVLNPRLDALELLETVCDELGISVVGAQGSVKQLVDRINVHLLTSNAAGRSTVLLIDEAQNLAADVLEQLRLLTNLETNERKLLRIILIGQPELADKLAQPELRQLAQRITARYHLEALASADSAAYVEHRLQIAGARQAVFDGRALRALHRASGGIPRLINVIADRALLGAYAGNRREIDASMVRKAAREVSGAPIHTRWRLAAGATVLVLGLSAVAAWALLRAREAGIEVPSAAGTAVQAPPALVTDDAALGAAAARRAGVIADADDGEPLLIEPPADAVNTDLMNPADARGIADPVPSSAASRPAAEAVLVRQQLPPWPSYLPRAGARAAAFATLFSRWRSPYSTSGDDACVHARKVGLACLRGNGDWDELAEINRPAVLELTGSDGATYTAALVGLRGNEAELVLADRTYRLPKSAIDVAWRGSFTLLWQLPPDYRGPLGPGATGAGVAWLREQLQSVTGEALTGTAQDRFDPALTNALRQFQSSQGLAADGRAGPRTWIALHDASGMDAPRLLESPPTTRAPQPAPARTPPDNEVSG